MKSLFTALILTLAFAGLVRQTNAQEKLLQPEAEQTISVRVGKQKKATRSKINFKFVSLLEDSRCPTNVQCIQAGNARIKVTAKMAGSDAVTFEANTNIGAKGGVYENYWFELTSLTPTPASNARLNRNAYTATFTVRRLSR